MTDALRLTVMLPPPPAGGVAPTLHFSTSPTSATWRAVVETAVPTVHPIRKNDR